MAQTRSDIRIEEPTASDTKVPAEPRIPGQARREPQRELEPRSGSGAKRFSLRPNRIYQLLKTTYFQYSKDKVPRMGAALAYYTIFSLAPLLVIAIAIAGLVFGKEAVQGQVMGQIQGLIGPESALAVQTILQSAHKPVGGTIATLFSVVVLLIGASGVFVEMQEALNEIWKVDDTSKTGVWHLIKSRFLSFGMVLGIGFLLLVSLLLSAALSAAANCISSFISVPPANLHAADFAFSFLFIAGLMALIFKLLPDVPIPWSDVWVGALLTSLFFTIGKFLIGFYVGKSIRMSAYGATGAVVIILAWVYYSAQILYFGAEFTRAFSNECGSRGAIRDKNVQAQSQGGTSQPART
jgi:membrane protein